ncbi:PD-(D/E)XK nuclease domain-containing protein [Aeromonas caviae]|uniref:PD-(D/E)XK nuclease domain-containing protein n=1 Tax=Aeromonas caviae TaxID=648 RepID=UPI0038CF9701
MKLVEQICSRFHLVSKQLKSRYNDRETLAIEDEYDTQDLLHALLHLYFDDIRSEEWTPSYAGGCSRVDFLLKQEKIVIEVKKTRKTLKAKDVGEQLIIDSKRYRAHPDCKKLLCFVYDPEGWVSNPRGLENDLNEKTDDFEIKVLIVPKGH